MWQKGFIIACKLYLKIKIREIIVKEQMQWVLIYVQEVVADVWKENVIDDLEARVLEFKIIREIFEKIKKKFKEKDKKLKKIVELKKLCYNLKTLV